MTNPVATAGLFPPIYDINANYNTNLENGPKLSTPIPERPPSTPQFDFLGVTKLSSRVGIPAGPLLGSQWVKTALEFGADFVCYKTTRTHAHPVNGHPNVKYVFADQPFKTSKLEDPLYVRHQPPETMEQLAITNSFGMPSQAPEVLANDIPKAIAAAKPGQVVIVSIVGSTLRGRSLQDDFVLAAQNAKKWGAQVVEANFSCPNVGKAKEGQLYLDPDNVYAISKAMVNALGNTPLIIKLGAFSSKDEMEAVLKAAHRAGVKAVAGINTISADVLNTNGTAALDQIRVRAGICGAPIREVALQFVRDARAVITENSFDLTLIGGGGVTQQSHFDLFLEAGADFVTCATGFMWNPLIFSQYHGNQSTPKATLKEVGKLV